MTILIYHGKYGNQYWRTDSDERLDAACRQLFKQLDGHGFYHGDVEKLAEARAGDANAIRYILVSRSGYEYEGWDIEEAIDPLTNPQRSESCTES